MDTLEYLLKLTNIFCQQLVMAIILLQDQEQMSCLIKHILTSSSSYNGIFEPSCVDKLLLSMVNDQAEATVNAAYCF